MAEEASKEYINDNDPIKEWLYNNYTITDSDKDRILVKDLYEQFKEDNSDFTILIPKQGYGK